MRACQLRVFGSEGRSCRSLSDPCIATTALLLFVALLLFIFPLEARAQAGFSNLMAWWPGEGSTNDIAGGNNGTLVGGVTFAPGKIGQGFKFDGTGYVSVRDNPSLRAVGEFTIEFWANLSTTAPTSWQTLLEKNYDYLIWWQAASNTIQILKTSACTGGYHMGAAASLPNLIPSTWHHFAFTGRDDGSGSSTFRIFVDGAEQTPTWLGWNGCGFLAAPPGDLRIGMRTLSSEPFTGLIDEVRIFNRALAAFEIQGLFDSAAAPATGLVTPDHCASGRQITVNILHSLIQPGATAKLAISGKPDIAGTNMTVLPSVLTATFDLNGAPAGLWDAMIINPDLTTIRIPGIFTIPGGVPPDLVAWWPGEGNAWDFTGKNNGTLVGSVMFAPGRVGQAFRFDGASYVSVSDDSSLRASKEITISLWVNFDKVPTSFSDMMAVFEKDRDYTLIWVTIDLTDQTCYPLGRVKTNAVELGGSSVPLCGDSLPYFQSPQKGNVNRKKDVLRFSAVHFVVSINALIRRGVYLVPFTIYVDDSGTDPNQRVACATALIIPAKRIPLMETEWETLKQKARFSDFHTSEFVARNKNSDFADWTDEKQKQVFARIRQVTTKYCVQALSLCVNKEDYEQIVPSKIREKFGRYHYSWALRHVLSFAREIRIHNNIREPYEWVLDWMDVGSPQRSEVENVMMQEEKTSSVIYGVEGEYKHYAFRDRKDFAGLQCADLVAWTNYQYYLLAVKNTPPKEFAKLARNDFLQKPCRILPAKENRKMRWNFSVFVKPESLKRWVEDELGNPNFMTFFRAEF